jgi:uncharacterized membrane protein YraQ (UPF0718 family)
MKWSVDFAAKCWEILGELAPWFLVGAAVAGLIHGLAFVTFVKQRLNGYPGVWLASLFGVPLPLCSCAVIPTGIGLRKSGASEGASIGFLISTPQTGVDSILVTAAFLGWPFAVFKLVVALVLGGVAGTIIEFWERRRKVQEAAARAVEPTKRSLSLPVLQPSPPAATSEATSMAAERRPQFWVYLRDSWLQAIEIIRSIYVWVLLGVLLSAVLTTWLPVGAIQSWLGPQGSWLQSPLALAISLPLYVCATASVPVAAALVHGGLSIGAMMVFLMAGPATNVATMGAIYRSFSRMAFATYLSTIVIGSMAAALVFDALVAGNWAVLPSPDHGHASAGIHQHGSGEAWGHAHGHWLNQVSAAVLLGLCLWFAVQSQYRRWWGGAGEVHRHG